MPHAPTSGAPPISANPFGFALRPVAEDISEFVAAGLPAISVGEWRLAAHDWDAEVAALCASPIPIASIVVANLFTLDQPARWPQERDRVIRTLAAAGRCRTPVVCSTTGPAGSLTWEQATDALARAVGPCLDEAARLGVALCFETTCQLRQEVGFVYTLRDQLAVADATGLSIGLDLYWAWREAGLLESVERAGDRLCLVQVSDWVPGTLSMPDRAVPGDGAIPLSSLLNAIRASGYTATMDLELLGPRITAEGPINAVKRGTRALTAMLAGGAPSGR